jgi:hypothetical protein
MSDELDLLVDALYALYTRTGKEVTHVTASGETRPYWANRYRQALKRAVDGGTVVEFVQRLVMQDEPSPGFVYLDAANRLDLSVEALVADESRSYHELFSDAAVAAARERLRTFGYEDTSGENAQM